MENSRLTSKSTFLRLRKKKFKQPKRQKDKCDYCVLGKALILNINKFLLENNPDIYDENFNLQLYLKEFSREIPDQQN